MARATNPGTVIRAALTAVALLAGILHATALSAQNGNRWSPALGLSVGTALEADGTPWGIGVNGEILRRSGRFSFGAELGYQGLGTETTRIENFDNRFGWVLIEDFSRSLIRIAALARYDLGSGPVRPYLIAGAGAYNGRFRDRIVVHDAAGARVPFYDFDGSGQDTKPAVSAGAGIVVARIGGRRLGVEGRWHGVFDVGEDGLGTVNFLTLGLTLRW